MGQKGSKAGGRGRARRHRPPQKEAAAPPVPPAGGGLAGVANLGRTCYVGAVLQALYACDEFRELVMLETESHDPLVAAVAEAFHAMAAAEDGCGGTVSPAAVVAAAGLLPGEEGDAHEFLVGLLARAADAGAEAGPASAAAEMARLLAPRAGGHPRHPRPEAAWTDEVFGGLTDTETTCAACGTVSSCTEGFRALSLGVDHNASLSNSVRRMGASHQLAGDDRYRCDACDGMRDARRRVRVRHAPRCLVLHLKRFGPGGGKLSSRVPFPLRFALPDDLLLDGGPGPDYELFAVVVHAGDDSRGHYLALVERERDGAWLLYDDELVSEVEANDVRGSFGSPGARTHLDAYLLLYREAL